MSIATLTERFLYRRPRGSPRAPIPSPVPSPHFRLSVVMPDFGPPCYHLADNRTGAVVYHGPIDGWAMVAVEHYLATQTPGEEVGHVD